MEHRERYINRGGRPLYSPRRPSSLTIETNASRALAYLCTQIEAGLSITDLEREREPTESGAYFLTDLNLP